jgi:hypothetical protein
VCRLGRWRAEREVEKRNERPRADCRAEAAEQVTDRGLFHHSNGYSGTFHLLTLVAQTRLAPFGKLILMFPQALSDAVVARAQLCDFRGAGRLDSVPASFAACRNAGEDE